MDLRNYGIKEYLWFMVHESRSMIMVSLRLTVNSNLLWFMATNGSRLRVNDSLH